MKIAIKYQQLFYTHTYYLPYCSTNKTLLYIL